jgi:acetyltransferase
MATTTIPAALPPHIERPVAEGGISIRPIDVADAEALSDFYAALSADGRHARFLGACSDVALRLAAGRLAGEPGFVAVLETYGPRDGEMVGHAVLSADRGGGAEIAFTVADGWRGRGIGTRLMRAVIEAARARGLRRLTAATYADNGAMRHVLLSAGLPVERDEIDSGVEELTLTLG